MSEAIEMQLSVTIDEARAVLQALSHFPINQAGGLYSKIDYQVALAAQAQANAAQDELPGITPPAAE